MKIAIRDHGRGMSVDGYGGLEQRFAAMWGYFLQKEGHDVHFFHERFGCDTSFDLALDCPPEPTRAEAIKAKVVVHNSFGTGAAVHPEVTNCDKYQRGDYVLSVPHREPYINGLGLMSQKKTKAQIVWMPLPYPDELMPSNLEKGFDRKEIWWGNKGNFDPVVDPSHQAYKPFVVNGINTLKALVKLNQKVDFKITFMLTPLTLSFSRKWPGEGVEELIGQLKNAERLNIIPWSELVTRISKCKLNTHPGGLTSSIHETLFTQGVPVTPKGSAHMFMRSPGIEFIGDRSEATVDEIYDTYDRLWFDEKYYNQVYDMYQDSFSDHRTDNVRKQWLKMLDILEIKA